MNSMLKNEILKNKVLYQISSLFIYVFLYLLISALLKEFYNPVAGTLTLIIAIIIDFYFSNKKIRIYLRILIILLIYIVIRLLIDIISITSSPSDTYNFFDKFPYYALRDSIVAIIFIIFYFIFDATKIKKKNIFGYAVSTLFLIIIFFVCLNNLNVESEISISIFKNYFNYSLFLILCIGLFWLRHIAFLGNFEKRKFEKKDFLLFLILLVTIIIFLFIFILPKHLSSNDKSNSGVLNQNLFEFDFNKFLELKDEIKLSQDKVLILELSGLDTATQNRINQGWDKQIYLKRYSLEEYKNGGFKVSDDYVDPDSPPVYLSGYAWELKKIPELKERSKILQTLYLINIDPSSLMGADLLTKVVPVTNWGDSTFKQIYKSYSYVLNTNYRFLMVEMLSQKKFTKSLSPNRKKILFNWANTQKEEKIKELAEQITSQYNDPFYKALSIQEYLRDNYLYSLKPGLAKDGDQLNHFLFESKKGYCTYFAFAMTLMLRSVGIPSRVAVGFAPDMKNSTLNFYEIRALDGHAWVEVYFDDYGWITFDPTSSNLAPGENLQMLMGNKEERDKYVEEILKNKDKMKDVTKKRKISNYIDDFTIKIKNSIQWLGLTFFCIIIAFFFLMIILKKKINLIRYKLTGNLRKKIINLYKHFIGKLFDLGYSIKSNESVEEYSERIKNSVNVNLDEITRMYQKALFREKFEFNVTKIDIKMLKNKINSEIKKISFGEKLFAFLNISRLWKQILPVILILFIFNTNLFPQKDVKEAKYNYTTLNEYIIESRKASEGDFYDKAIEILNEAEKKYSYSYEPNLAKAKLYQEKELYNSALTEFLKTKKKGLSNEFLYFDIADCYGRIGEDRKGVLILEEAYNKLPKTKEIYDNLGWMYFKVHNTNKGIKIVREGLLKYPTSPDLLMTLGTLYSDSWNYELAKKNYLDAVDNSILEYKTNKFRSIVYYNLSILENSFLYYDESFNFSKAAISLEDRSTPHVQLNYLYLGALDLKNAYNELLTASNLEPKTLFPEMSMAYIYIMSGRVDDGIKLIKQLLDTNEFSWMLYFGANKESFYADLYKNLATAYEFKSYQIKYNEENSFINITTRPFRIIYYKILNYFYNFRFANLSIKIGEQLIKGGSELEGLHQLYDAYEKILDSKAYKILVLTESIEGKLNPKKQRFFNIKKAILKKKIDFFYLDEQKENVIKENYKYLDEKWEKDLKCVSLYELIISTKGLEREKYIEELFLLHSPFIPLNDFKVGFNIKLSKNIDGKKMIKILNYRCIEYSYSSNLNMEIDKHGNIYNFRIFNKNNLLKSFSYEMNKKENYEKMGVEIFKNIFISDI